MRRLIGVCIFCLCLSASTKVLAGTPININSSVTADYQVSDPNGNYLVIGSGGRVNGAITNSDPANPGHVDITNYGGTYNTGTFNTTFGSSGSYLSYVLAAGNNTTLTISNNFYSSNVYLENSTLNINNNSNISNISIHNGVLNKKAGSTININTNYDQVTKFGYYQNNLVKNMSIESMNVSNGTTLTLKDYAYVDNINLTGSGSKIILSNSDARIIGLVSGAGSVDVNVNYNDSLTRFGKSTSNTLNKLNVNNASLTLEESSGYVNNAYVTNLVLNGLNSSLNINANANLYGSVYGSGVVNINTSYSNTGTKFGTVSNSLAKLSVNNAGTDLMLSIGTAYIDDLFLNANTSLSLEGFAVVNGTIRGGGSVNINNTSYTNGSNTIFGTSTSSLYNLNLNGSTLTLSNTAYINTTNVSVGSSMFMGANGGVNGTIRGDGLVVLLRNYDTSNPFSLNYFNTNFGTSVSVLDHLHVGDGANPQTLTLGNLAYTDNLILVNSSILNLQDNSGVIGSIYGVGMVSINTDYSTTDVDGVVGNNTNLGTLTNSISSVWVSDDKTLTIGNSAYIDDLTLNNNSILTLEKDSAISGIVHGLGIDATINVNGIFATNSLGTGNYTYFGTSSSDRINMVNINSNGSLTLNTNTYIDKINITAVSSYTAPSLALKGLEAASNTLTLNTFQGIDYDYNSNLAVLMTLRNTPGDQNNEYMKQLHDLSQMINNNITENFKVENNNLYVDILSRAQAEGDKFLIDTNASASFFNEATLIYETIFKDLKLETEVNLNGDTELYLVVKQDRTPTTSDVSGGTIVSSSVVDKWRFIDRSFNESVLVANLQGIVGKTDFFHALRNISPDASGLNNKIPTQSITSAVSNIDKRLSYFRMMRFDSKTNNYNLKNLSLRDKRYYDDYFTKPYPENNIWIEVFGGNLKQNEVDKIFGYDANFYGGTIGYDIRVNTNFVFGMSYTFNSVDANDLDYIKSDRDNLSATTQNGDLYMMLYNKWNYLTLNVGGGFNDYEQERKINFSNFNKTAKADYNGYSYHVGVEYGFNHMLYDSLENKNKKSNKKDASSSYLDDKCSKDRNNIDCRGYNRRNRQNDDDYSSYSYDKGNEYYDNRIVTGVNYNNTKNNQVNKGLKTYNVGPIRNFVMLTPKISLTYDNIVINDYTETGADAASLEIKTENYETLDLNGGLSLTLSKGLSRNVSFQTILSGVVSYALINDKVELEARYIDDENFFRVFGIEPNDLTYSTGIDFNFNFFDRVDLSLGYNYVFTDNFRGQMLRLTFLWAF